MSVPHSTQAGRLPAVIAVADAVAGVSTADLLSHDAPAISVERAADLAMEIYGITGTIRPLSAEKDANFHISLASGQEALLKITNAAEDRAVTDMQTAALIHLMAVDPSLPVPHVCQTLSGAASHIITEPTGQAHVVRLLTYLNGTVLSMAEDGSGLYHDIGALLARLTRALRGFFHPAGGHLLQWDIKQAHRLRPMLAAVEDSDLRGRLTRLLDRFDAEIAPRLPNLRAQCVHNDFNPHNLLVDAPRATRITGIIDFGDMVHTPIACDLAVACSYQIANGPRPMDHIAKMITGYNSVLPLEDAEIEMLPDLIRLRHATTLGIGAWRARRYPQNAEYIQRNGAASLRGLNALDQISHADVINALQAAMRASEKE
ncbi:phosphotransferase [Pseudohalocynthiibacter aestuariivivens]|uniref:Hydroxylysine kinase n=1 Tax=Roseovarius pelagicus TaxID=2980108 RepID=A0ABY6DBV8_9RHOB|nr:MULTISPECIES: phosphotransferase [Rhodobacterales]QIE44479.1 phosphotransferase [Pseudohalocynthiibacter aestuariivivens]UXX83621.1 phosphotransferase [Roseovarius pelagicus]